jgi:pyridoxine kinase
MQLLGMEVDVINSVHFSNHTGYPSFSGKHLRLNGDDVKDLLDGLEQNHLLQDAYTHLLTGYIGSLSLLEAVVQVRTRILNAKTADSKKKFLYVCDPVLGDEGRLYVPNQLGM